MKKDMKTVSKKHADNLGKNQIGERNLELWFLEGIRTYNVIIEGLFIVVLGYDEHFTLS